MKRAVKRASFWTWLTTDGRCRLCAAEDRDIRLSPDRVLNGGTATAVRLGLINHARAWHPEATRLIEAGEVLPLHALHVCPFARHDRLAVSA